MEFELDKFEANITQIRLLVEKRIISLEEFLSGDIRTIGLREKCENRHKTLLKVQEILTNHDDLNAHSEKNDRN